MDLFVIKRYVGDENEEDTYVQEKDHLAQLLAKVEERKKKNIADRNVPQPINNIVAKTIEDTETTAEPVENHNSSVKKSKKRKHKESNNQDSDKLEYCDAPQDIIKESTTTENLVEPQNDEEGIRGFAILGSDNFKKKPKVKRVLPHWLANPSVIAVDLHDLNTAVDDIPCIDKDILQKLKENKISYFFPVQIQVIPWLISAYTKPVMYRPHDVCVSAPTGSGKTLAYVIPMVQALKRRIVPHVRALVVLPVQDLAVQVFNVFRTYCKGTVVEVALITGQTSFEKEQNRLVKTSTVAGSYSGVDIVVTTPGRLIDHIKRTPGFTLKYLRFLVIDEADRVMESVQNDWLYHVNQSVTTGSSPFLTVASLKNMLHPPQKLLFSATLSQDPEKLQRFELFQPKLFTSIVSEQVSTNGVVDVTSGDIRGDFVGKYTTPAELTEKYCLVSISSKPLVLHYLISKNKWQHVLCFTNSQQTAHRLSVLLSHLGQEHVIVAEISAALKRQKRDEILQKFSKGQINILVSSDALTRGIDIPVVDYVISYDLPKYIKTYIHRIGRTGRAGRHGTAVTFVLHTQKGRFQHMLQTAGKTSPKELVVSETELEPLEEKYKEALNALKVDMEKEQSEVVRKVHIARHTAVKINTKSLTKKIKLKKKKKKALKN